MNVIFHIYLGVTCVIGTLTILWLILGLIYMLIHSHKENKAMKDQMNEFKEAIKNTGLGKDLNRPLTDDEKELLEKTGHLEFTETLNLDTLKVKKEMKN